ncbi:SanA/YdcF family protein [Chromohalobacter canadensis]|uniref:ElyC/SanA/YdcF family protein n=1 Tax=Chromohalobacter canadensis TaxID=141389 RepID=A0A285VJ89_9GAMM|nr:ElyC/SanA/YdcF family protein [Chromohalobacter canadensis]MCK0767991.1 YdcF family protein [Chromohalobacter canadensis]MCT8467697.1 YdcF family protein [Chromohalobacter canadensis]MCT8470555.1 YdcF family protein [Chromohalobacter canadensis]MCT8498194.1 YdcF family protein [Chromohalobacter canadensis]WQH08559.1 ElyC/SanA/YdcF family protein [Chromohalobacter canadensis]
MPRENGRRGLIRWGWRLLKWCLVGVIFMFVVVVVLNIWVFAKTTGRIHHDTLVCDAEPVGLVFGTAEGLRGGGHNPYFSARMEAAAQLLRLGRVQHLLLSGDNRTRYYNEPVSMWRSLRTRNVGSDDMTLDYAGFSTFDSVVRARRVFGAEHVLLISQAWHLPRALFIADAVGLKAEGCAVPDGRVGGEWQLWLREWLARAATVGDIYLWGRVPYFLGPPETLPIRKKEE